jgi:hypothetical protein
LQSALEYPQAACGAVFDVVIRKGAFRLLLASDQGLAAAGNIDEDFIELTGEASGEVLRIAVADEEVGATRAGKCVVKHVQAASDDFVGKKKSMGTEPFGDRRGLSSRGRTQIANPVVRIEFEHRQGEHRSCVLNVVVGSSVLEVPAWPNRPGGDI